ncbi:hypothetical protein GCM10011611_61360 [Aliidongia dinghuensis]|uniref:Lipoprotein n=2 Tax=Aliidongia dinghuensis TaxID=1867774 RepID=A0A8J3E7P1_9PROT|nr:hypothetical protein GCM10011611_61360 [Aliidongia dinghuensis]
MNGRILRLAGVLMVVLSLAACGKKGAPMAPKDEPNTYPRAYPTDTSPDSTGTPAKPADQDVFPSLDRPNTNIDPTRPRSTE